MRIEHVKTARLQNLFKLKNTANDIAHTIHKQRVHNKTRLAQALGELSVRLTNSLKIVATLAHRYHFFKDSVLLSAKTCGGL